MKEIAHSYVAEKATGKKGPNLYLGCLLPDFVPYTVASEMLRVGQTLENADSEEIAGYLNDYEEFLDFTVGRVHENLRLFLK